MLRRRWFSAPRLCWSRSRRSCFRRDSPSRQQTFMPLAQDQDHHHRFVRHKIEIDLMDVLKIDKDVVSPVHVTELNYVRAILAIPPESWAQ